LSIASACSGVFDRMIAPRGPRSVLWVVKVTTSMCGNGEGCAPPAISPAMCETSPSAIAPTSRAISPKALKSIVRGRRVAAEQDVRPELEGLAPHRVHVDHVLFVDSVVLHIPHIPVTLTGLPCVRCPPWSSRSASSFPCRLHEGGVDGDVGRRPGERLDVGVGVAEDRLGALDDERLERVRRTPAPGSTAGRGTLAVLVREGEARAARTAGEAWFSEGSGGSSAAGGAPRARSARRRPGRWRGPGRTKGRGGPSSGTSVGDAILARPRKREPGGAAAPAHSVSNRV